jgi:hypothetical protein
VTWPQVQLKLCKKAIQLISNASGNNNNAFSFVIFCILEFRKLAMLKHATAIYMSWIWRKKQRYEITYKINNFVKKQEYISFPSSQLSCQTNLSNHVEERDIK